MQQLNAHLLNICVDEIKRTYEEVNQEKRENLKIFYSFQKDYRPFNLCQIKEQNKNRDSSMNLIKDVISRFANKSNIRREDLIDLLIGKSKRNYNVHGYIDNYLYDILHNKLQENDIISFIEKKK